MLLTRTKRGKRNRKQHYGVRDWYQFEWCFYKYYVLKGELYFHGELFCFMLLFMEYLTNILSKNSVLY